MSGTRPAMESVGKVGERMLVTWAMKTVTKRPTTSMPLAFQILDFEACALAAIALELDRIPALVCEWSTDSVLAWAETRNATKVRQLTKLTFPDSSRRFQLKETKRLECTAPLPKGKTPTPYDRPWNVIEERCEDMRDIYNRILEKVLEEGGCITARPGRGKTVLTKWLAAEAEKRGEVVLTAPTHVAAKVLDPEMAITLARYCHKSGKPLRF